MKYPGKGSFINVSKDAPFVLYDTVSVTMKLKSDIAIANLSVEKFNFYIISNVLKKGRGIEVHLADGIPTSLADKTLFGTYDDKSNGYKYYRTVNNLPWAINIIQGFDYMFEKISIDKGYTNFIKWAESSGQSYQDWFDPKTGNRNTENIYHQ
jgi:LruC domain-containing protein